MPWRIQYIPDDAEYLPIKDIDLEDYELEAIEVALANAARISYLGAESSFFTAHDKIHKRKQELGLIDGDSNDS